MPIRQALTDFNLPPRGVAHARPRELRWSLALAHQPSRFRKSRTQTPGFKDFNTMQWSSERVPNVGGEES
jgi:hypothetical protein